jgi:hypothetical protein
MLEETGIFNLVYTLHAVCMYQSVTWGWGRAQGYGSYLACTRLWVPSSAPQKGLGRDHPHACCNRPVPFLAWVSECILCYPQEVS